MKCKTDTPKENEWYEIRGRGPTDEVIIRDNTNTKMVGTLGVWVTDDGCGIQSKR